MSKEKVAIYHKIMRRENFEVAAKDIIRLLRNTQESAPGKPRVLYVDIDGHRNKDGEFDQDMLELQNEFGIGVLLQFFEEIHFPLIDVKNSKGQNNDVPDKLEIFKAKNKRDTSLDALYIENYSNTEFMSEPMVYNYLKHFTDFLRYYKEGDSWKEENVFENTSETMLFTLWYRHLNEIINELFNNFIYGNLLSTAAMTRTLIECYVYISILIKEQNAKLIEEWFFCNLMTKMKKNDELKIEIVGAIKEYCNNQGIDFEVVYQKLLYKNENSWLSSVINKKRITFRDACEYLVNIPSN